MSGRIGGKAKPGHQGKPLDDGDVYTVPEVAEIIAEKLFPHFLNGWSSISSVRILDACAGEGVLGKAMKNCVKKVYDWKKWDKLVLQDKKIDGTSILDFKSDKPFDIIICNPRWKVDFASKTFFHLRRMLGENGVLFFLIENAFMYRGWERARKLDCQKFYFLPRFAFKWSGRPLLDCGIAVHHANPNEISRFAMSQDCYIDIPPGLIVKKRYSRAGKVEEQTSLF